MDFLNVKPATSEELEATESISANHGLEMLPLHDRLAKGLIGCDISYSLS